METTIALARKHRNTAWAMPQGVARDIELAAAEFLYNLAISELESN